jgi:hypothetical protein
VIASSEVVAVEIVRTLVGSIGLMASVPLTTALAAWLAREREDRVVVEATDDDVRRRRREPDELDGPSPFADEGYGDQEWERRLRSSYGLRDRGQRATAGDERRT